MEFEEQPKQEECEVTIQEQKEQARIEKQSLIQKILICQKKLLYVPEILEKKNLKQLRQIFEQVRKQQ